MPRAAERHRAMKLRQTPGWLRVRLQLQLQLRYAGGGRRPVGRSA
jgi:hypothetical protein